MSTFPRRAISVPTLLVFLLIAASCTGSEGPTLADPPTTTSAVPDTTPAAAPRIVEMVRFVEPLDGAEIYGSVPIVMLAKDELLVAPASDRSPGAGHFAVLVDQACVPEGEMMPGDQPGVHHFADGGTQKTLELATGRHVLCLQFQTSDRVATGHTDSISIIVR